MNVRLDKAREIKKKPHSNSYSEWQNDSVSNFHFNDNRPETNVQLKVQEAANNSSQAQKIIQLQNLSQSIQKKENNTGLPNNLKSGIENLSGHSMDDVKVHYNSPKPAQLEAHAYAQGTEIHIAYGQEKHLPHEAWHVVQQKQGRVKPTTQLQGKVNINDDLGLEKEADMMGLMANRSHQEIGLKNENLSTKFNKNSNGVLQAKFGYEFETIANIKDGNNKSVDDGTEIKVYDGLFKLISDGSRLEIVTDPLSFKMLLKLAKSINNQVIPGLKNSITSDNEEKRKIFGTDYKFIERKEIYLRGKPQLSVGIGIDTIMEFIELMSGGHGEIKSMTSVYNKDEYRRNEKEYVGGDKYNEVKDKESREKLTHPKEQLPRNSRFANTQSKRNNFLNASNLSKSFIESQEKTYNNVDLTKIKGFIAMLYVYILSMKSLKDRKKLRYVKSYFQAMARTDFQSWFKEIVASDPENKDILSKVLMDALEVNEIEKDEPLLPHGVGSRNPKILLSKFTAQRWFETIVENPEDNKPKIEDKYEVPDPKEIFTDPKEMELPTKGQRKGKDLISSKPIAHSADKSLGALGVDTEGLIKKIVFELRGFRGVLIEHDDWLEILKESMNHLVNSGSAPKE